MEERAPEPSADEEIQKLQEWKRSPSRAQSRRRGRGWGARPWRREPRAGLQRTRLRNKRRAESSVWKGKKDGELGDAMGKGTSIADGSRTPRRDTAVFWLLSCIPPAEGLHITSFRGSGPAGPHPGPGVFT